MSKHHSPPATLRGTAFSAPGKWGQMQMGSDGFNRIFTGFYLFGTQGTVGVCLAPLKTLDFKGLQPALSGL